MATRHVASVVGVNGTNDEYRAETMRALADAAAFPGPSVILALASPAGVDPYEEVAVAVESGGWPLYSWDPRNESEPLRILSKTLRSDLKTFKERANAQSMMFNSTPKFCGKCWHICGCKYPKCRADAI